MSAMARTSNPVDHSPRRGPRRAEWALSALIVVLQFLAPRTGEAAPESLPVWAGMLVLFMALGGRFCSSPMSAYVRSPQYHAGSDLLRRPEPGRGRRASVCSVGGDLSVGSGRAPDVPR